MFLFLGLKKFSDEYISEALKEKPRFRVVVVSFYMKLTGVPDTSLGLAKDERVPPEEPLAMDVLSRMHVQGLYMFRV